MQEQRARKIPQIKEIKPLLPQVTSETAKQRIGDSPCFYYPKIQLGSGSFATVYLGYHSKLCKQLAVKKVAYNKFHQNLKYFERELEVLSEIGS